MDQARTDLMARMPPDGFMERIESMIKNSEKQINDNTNAKIERLEHIAVVDESRLEEYERGGEEEVEEEGEGEGDEGDSGETSSGERERERIFNLPGVD